MSSTRIRGPLALGLATAAATLAMSSGAQAAEAPSFQCRASALAASISEQPYVEPLVANGVKGSVPGRTFDKAACSNDEQGAGDTTNSVGLQGLAGLTAAKVKTTLVPETGSSKAQTATATTQITDLDVRLGSTPSKLLQVGAVQASATAKCVNGKAEFTGTSQVTDVKLLGMPIPLDGLLSGLQQLLDSSGLSAVVKITALNQVTKTADGVVVTPLRVQVLSGAGSPGGVLDLTIGETKVAQRGNACNPPADDGGGEGGPATVCPVGSVAVGTSPAVCQIPGTDRYGTIIIGALGTDQVPTGGRVVPLPEARRLAAAGQIPKSLCLSSPGLNYVVLGDSKANTIYGTKFRDRLISLGGADKVHGRNAGDCVDGGSGNDRLYGDSGNDRLYGSTGNDRIYADRGNDRLYGQAGNDLLRGNDGADRLSGAAGNDRLYGNDGRDTVDGGAGRDRLSGGFNTNRIIGGTGRALVVNGKPQPGAKARSVIDLRKATAPSVVKCGSRRDVVRVTRKYAARNRYSSNCTTIRVSR
ncbi:calcium-binding protein [Patulibacter minatonensis]|uniref:calcium-binding protein n=1 Tax=Patulibacter minatonensis TaxID=298163 RepID=UPI0004AE9B61|nr:calcium-binding protein [Patulibacter minatonensis]